MPTTTKQAQQKTAGDIKQHQQISKSQSSSPQAKDIIPKSQSVIPSQTKQGQTTTQDKPQHKTSQSIQYTNNNFRTDNKTPIKTPIIPNGTKVVSKQNYPNKKVEEEEDEEEDDEEEEELEPARVKSKTGK